MDRRNKSNQKKVVDTVGLRLWDWYDEDKRCRNCEKVHKSGKLIKNVVTKRGYMGCIHPKQDNEMEEDSNVSDNQDSK